MKSVLISIHPKRCEKILNGEKIIEVRKTRPKLEMPFKCYIYMTAGLASYTVQINGYPYTCHNGGRTVIGEFICDRIDEYILTLNNGDNYDTKDFNFSPLKEACLTQAEIVEYGKGKPLYGWRISDLKIYDKPKGLNEFRKTDCDCPYITAMLRGAPCYRCHERDVKHPPKSWCYVEELEK